MRLGIAFPGALCALFLASAAAAPVVTVEAVQFPAWLERGGNTVPLVPGVELQGRDKVRTGGNARAKLKFADGSTVKLGENAKFEIERAEDPGFLRASLRVVAGAFRFAGEGLRISPRRSVSIQVRNVTIGIRGTDLWGKSTEERDLVCLIEGTISVGSAGNPTVKLDQPLDFYQVPRGGAPAVAKVDQKQLEQWALETETRKDGPVGQVGGQWRVIAATLPARDAALALSRSLRAQGYPAQVTGGQAGPFSVRVVGLAGEEEARALMQNLRSVEGVTNSSVER
ncbi:MAG: FecR domain-containing protein [Betaproteobacteria bacterium]|nr:FecR domain-containing protein [Betaproteobacteria bacterium]